MDMNRRHRAATMFLLFVLLLGGLGLLTADLSAGQQQILGRITEAGNPTNRLAGVSVALLDAHGQKATETLATGLDGTYTFTPTSGFYKITVKTPGFFDNETEVFRFDNTATLRKDIEMVKMPDAVLMLTVHVEDAFTADLEDATVEVTNTTAAQSLGTNLTNASGDSIFFVWAGTFEIKVEKQGFETEIMVVALSMDTVVPVILGAAVSLVGNAQEPGGPFISQGLVAFLYNLDMGTPPAKRLLIANVTGSLYTFSGYPGDFILIVDADGKAGNITQITVTGAEDISRTLDDSPEERADTVIEYNQGDWNRLYLWRNLTLNDDSTFPGLPFAFVRHLRLQIDLALGNGDGTLNETEREVFRAF
ncbi:MAG: carboxypeptidase-like regulatory domain-containing protein, partial [Thermoplasmata archaeon]